ncbi:sirohydrochlorin cobaltochelatase [Desulfococcus sp.]|uniref:sirohydrochlorin cobaltochelatase n=1 Tax=Desulfococcus sp. TaxID=2025834 RepID=UPI003593A570
MTRKTIAALITFFLVSLLSTAAMATGHPQASGHSKADEKGPAILLVTFGTSIPSAQAAFANIDAQVKKAFPGMEVRWAYTSHIIRKKLAREGKLLDSPEVALAKLMDDGYSRVAVQSLHMIPGLEFHEIHTNAKRFEKMVGGFDKVFVAYPLLSSNDAMDTVVKILPAAMIPKERTPGDAVVLMGHGTHHTSDAIYSAMMYKFQNADPNIYVGTVEGHPTFDEVKALLVKKGIKKAYLLPFMSVAGDHARNDLAGDDPDSWKSMLTLAGIECVPVLKGVAEYNALVDLWIQNLKTAMKHLE